MRIANLPGVASHVLTGGLLAWWLEPGGIAGGGGSLPWVAMGWAAFAGVLLCVGGNLLNDWHDLEWDKRHRPERALPSGYFAPRTFWVAGSISLLASVFMMFAVSLSSGIIALGIAACVVIYTRIHKQTRASVIPLALCRALLPWLGAACVHGLTSSGIELFSMVGAAGVGLFLWVCGLSLDARRESTGDARRSPLPLGLILLAPMLPLVVAYWHHHAVGGLEILPAYLWLGVVFGPLRHSAKQRVSGLLAGLPLLDFTVIALIWNAPPDTPMFLLLLPLLAFALGRALQRLAAAT